VVGDRLMTKMLKDKSMSEPIINLKPDYSAAMDYRGMPVEVCPCGSEVWNVKCKFKDGEITMYFLDMECAVCGSLATAPTPVDVDGCD